MKKTNGELTVMVEDIKDALGTKIDSARMMLTADIGRVETQTTKTNGRVTWLEQRAYMMTGALAVIMALVIPLLVYVWRTSQSIDQRVSAAVEQQFSQYNIQSK